MVEAYAPLLSPLPLCALSYTLVVMLIPYVSIRMPPHLSGKDLCKKGTLQGEIPIPESLGIVSGSVYVIILCAIAYFIQDNSVRIMLLSGNISIFMMLILGIFDDLNDLRWRHKLIYPLLASIPLLYMYPGMTFVILPKHIRSFFAKDTVLAEFLSQFFEISDDGSLFDIGYLYYVYMAMMVIFCTNAINIYAGVNGLEVGQSCVIAIAVIVLNLTQVLRGHDNDHYHYLSMMLMLPFVATALGLLRFNWYPARVFVGDTFCYYAGMTFAAAGILGHCSKTLLLFFIPQILNFLYSIPQLLHWIPCPRHRLPKFNAKTGLLEPSTISETSRRSNLTVINAVLVVNGPMHERKLVMTLLCLQILSCGVAFYIRYGLSGLFYDVVG